MDSRARAGFAVAAVVFAMIGIMSRQAEAIPFGWSCVGTCGTLGPDGVVTAPPGFPAYEYVSTFGSSVQFPLLFGEEVNGSLLQSNVFSANAGDNLQFYFNYVTSDGAEFTDYAAVRLLNEDLTPAALLFTARTTIGGDTVPGFGMPPANATLLPASTPIIPGEPDWSPLGFSSGSCFDTGCGYTGWIQSNYTISAGGNYILQFVVVNWADDQFDSGLAIAGTNIEGTLIPEPTTAVFLGGGLFGLGMYGRRRQIAPRSSAMRSMPGLSRGQPEDCETHRAEILPGPHGPSLVD